MAESLPAETKGGPDTACRQDATPTVGEAGKGGRGNGRRKPARLCGECTRLLGDHSGREPPDPIPNSEVKPPSADDSVAVCHAKVGNRQAPYNKTPRYP